MKNNRDEKEIGKFDWQRVCGVFYFRKLVIDADQLLCKVNCCYSNDK